MNRFLIVLIMAGVAEAHSGNRLYPFYELTDEMLEQIDLHDGLIDEWYEIGEPSMTLLDFKTLPVFMPPDPSNLDFRIWLAWHDESDRIFAAFIVSDDEYKNTHDWSAESIRSHIPYHDSITLLLDADHSGGRGSRNETPADEYPLIFGRTQEYHAISRTASGPTLVGWTNRALGEPPASWRIFPPYGDAGGGVAGENPVVWIIEMYVTPQNAWGDNIEDTLFSELTAHQVVGFAPIIHEFDPSVRNHPIPWHPEAVDDEGALDYLDRGEADLFIDGLLVPAQGTAVESDTWGRLKASLE